MNKLEEMKKMLDKVGIECRITYYRIDKKLSYKGNVICRVIEWINGTSTDCYYLTEFEQISLEYPINYQSVSLEEAFKRIKYCVENNTDTYVEVEEFEVGDEVSYLEIGLFDDYFKATDMKNGKISKINDLTIYADLYELDNGIKLNGEDVASENIKLFKSKRKCLEYLYLESHKRELKEKKIKKDLLKEMGKLKNE